MNFQDLDAKVYKDIEEEILFCAVEEHVEKELEKNKALNKSKKKKKKKYSSTLKSGLKIRTVVLLILTLLVNTYAWFIYISTVSMGIAMHVKNWDFELSNGEQTQNFEFLVEEIYPGMEPQTQEISAKNNGETAADLSCDILGVNVLGTEYKIGDSYQEDGVTKTYTSEKLFEILDTYPFKLQIYMDDILYDGTPVPMVKGESVEVIFKISWDYETGNTEEEIETSDVIDTYWGNEAYKFMQNNPDEYSIKIEAKIKAVQNNP